MFVKVDSCLTGTNEAASYKLLVISIFPNPASETIHVSLPNTHYPLRITITDISGRVILQTTQTEISVSHLAKGLYFVRMELSGGESVVRKIVVQ